MNRRHVLAAFVLAAALAVIASVPAAAASFSRFWKQSSDESWYIEDNAGNRITNAWLCDDAVPENGNRGLDSVIPGKTFRIRRTGGAEIFRPGIRFHKKRRMFSLSEQAAR